MVALCRVFWRRESPLRVPDLTPTLSSRSRVRSSLGLQVLERRNSAGAALHARGTADVHSEPQTPGEFDHSSAGPPFPAKRESGG